MRSIIICLFLPLLMALSACGVQTSAKEGMTESAAATLQQVRAEVDALASGRGEETVGDVQERFRRIDELLQTAGGQAKGLAQAAIFNLRTSLAGYAGVVAKVPASAELSELPGDFAATREAVGKRFRDLATNLGLS